MWRVVDVGMEPKIRVFCRYADLLKYGETTRARALPEVKTTVHFLHHPPNARHPMKACPVLCSHNFLRLDDIYSPLVWLIDMMLDHQSKRKSHKR